MLKKLLISFTKVTLSVFLAGVFYVAWMAVTITAFQAGCCLLIKAALWLAAPIMTAAGFTAGIIIVELFDDKNKVRFIRTFLYPLIGCTVGALSVVWIGPMLIVFGMFLVGTAAVGYREIKRLCNSSESSRT